MAQQKLLLGHVKGDPGPAGPAGKDSGFGTITATIDGDLGEPSVDASWDGDNTSKNLTLAFHNLKGEEGKVGPAGPVGPAAGFGEITATIDGGNGTPKVDASWEGPGEAKNLTLAFHELKGDKGETGPQGEAAAFSEVDATIDGGYGTPQVEASLSGEETAKKLTLAFHDLQGAKGDTGAAAGFGAITVSVDRSSEGEPSAEANWSGDDTSKDLTIDFKNLKGDKGDPGVWTPAGDITQLVLGDGTYATIASILQDNIETIRAALGVATVEHNGLMPQLPENPEAE